MHVHHRVCIQCVYRGRLSSGLINQLSDVGQIPAQRFSQHAQRLYTLHQAHRALRRLLQLPLRLIG